MFVKWYKLFRIYVKLTEVLFGYKIYSPWFVSGNCSEKNTNSFARGKSEHPLTTILLKKQVAGNTRRLRERSRRKGKCHRDNTISDIRSGRKVKSLLMCKLQQNSIERSLEVKNPIWCKAVSGGIYSPEVPLLSFEALCEEGLEPKGNDGS